MSNELALSTQGMLQLSMQLSKSKVVPQVYQRSPENVFAALQMAKELNITPMAMLNNSYPVNNKVTLMTDMMVALAKKHPDYGGMVINATDKVCTVTVKRINPRYTEEFTSTFSLEDAQRAGLIERNPDTWKKYPRRMLKHRALAFVIRDAFPDVFAGVYTTEEMMYAMPGDKRVDLSDDPENTVDGTGSTVIERDLFEDGDPDLNRLMDTARATGYSDDRLDELRKRYYNVADTAVVKKRFLATIYKALAEEAQNDGK